MQLRSGRRLVSPPAAPRGDLRRGRPRGIVPDGGANGNDGEDRISDIPEELLLDVLRRLGCARQAARTGVLSRRWRGLWAELRELKFEGVDADVLESALARVRPNLSCLDISVRNPRDGDLTGAQITSLLRAADRLAPAELVVCLVRDDYSPDRVRFEIPCFTSATSMDLYISGHQFTLAPAGEFASLKQLTLTFRFRVVDLAVLLSHCPRLRELRLCICFYMRSNTVAIESKSLDELTFSMDTNWPADVIIVAPELKKFSLEFHMSEDLTLSYSTPKLEEFLFKHTCEHPCAGFGNKWILWSLRMETQWSNRNGSHPGVRVHVLSLSIGTNHRRTSIKRSIAQEVARHLVRVFTDMELSIRTEGHAFGPLLLHLPFIQTSIQRLKLDLMKNYSPECSQNCDCDQDGNWRNQEISLPDLQDVEIHGFSAADHEVDFLQLVFRSAPNLKRMNVKLSEEVSPSGGGCQKLRSIFEANASVKCNVYVESGDLISFA